MFYELLKPTSYTYFSFWQLNLHLINSRGTFFTVFMMFDDPQWWFRWICLSFNIEVHIRTALCLHYSQLFIMAIRRHFQLSGGCLVHLQTKWAANLYYSISIYPGISFTYTGCGKKKTFVTVMRLNSHTYSYEIETQNRHTALSLPLSMCPASHQTWLIHCRVS